MSISFFAHGLRMGLLVSAMRGTSSCLYSLPCCMMGPGPVSPGTLKYAVPFIRTQVILLEEKSGIRAGAGVGCAPACCHARLQQVSAAIVRALHCFICVSFLQSVRGAMPGTDPLQCEQYCGNRNRKPDPLRSARRDNFGKTAERAIIPSQRQVNKLLIGT